jgi:hypothetical protein
MGIARTWRQLRALKAAGQAANEAAAPDTSGQQPQGMMAGLINVMADAMAPRMAASAERRGAPLPGSDTAVIDGSAWTHPVADATAIMRARDSAFDTDLLARFAEQVFTAIVAVWTGADAGSVRPVMSDGLWEPLAGATGALPGGSPWTRLGHQHPTVVLTGLHAGTWYDSARFTIHVALIGDQIPPAMPPEMRQWDEDWLFQRSVQPGGDPMIRPPACPACGAPNRTDEADLCLHCRAPVPYLTTGWLVTEIFSHHPGYAIARENLAKAVRANPELVGRVPPHMRPLLPPNLDPVDESGRPTGISP